MRHIAARLAQIPGVEAVTLGGSRASGTAAADSDWDFGLYYSEPIDPRHVEALGWPGRVFAPGDWGTIVNGGAWLEIENTRVDLVYRDLTEVMHWTGEAEHGRFEIRREVGYVAGIATYVVAGELALGEVLRGTLPRPDFPDALAETAPRAWYQLAAGALHFAYVYAHRGDRIACLANATQAVLATAQGRLAAAGVWVLNEKGIVARAGLDEAQSVVSECAHDVSSLIGGLKRVLALPEWAG